MAAYQRFQVLSAERQNLFLPDSPVWVSRYQLSRDQEGGKRLLRASVSESRYEKIKDFFAKSHKIFNRYIAFNLLDSLIIGCVNAIFMTALGMPYAIIVSVVVGVANLVPTFGPIVGAVIGAVILLLAGMLAWSIFGTVEATAADGSTKEIHPISIVTN